MRERVRTAVGFALAALTAGFLAAAAAGAVGLATAAGAPGTSAATAAPGSGQVRISVLSVTPSSPARTYSQSPLSIVVSVTNQSDRPLTRLRIEADRGDPISTPEALAKTSEQPTPASAGGLPIASTVKPSLTLFSLAPGATTQVTFSTTTSIAQGAGLCVCDNQVYPILLSVHSLAANGSDTSLAATTTYLPVFLTPPQRLRVGWIWPIIEPPHRLTSDTTFIDNGLAAAIAPGGRLDRLLSVLEQVPPGTPMTVLFDPETLDGIQVMTGAYRVQTGRTSRAGTDQQVAATWLTRLRAALAAHPDFRVELTPYADPDVESLSSRGLRWQTALPPAMAARVATALGPVATYSELAWPAAARISTRTLAALVRTGVSTVVVNSSNVRSSAGGDQPDPPAVSRLRSGTSRLDAVLIDPAVSDQVARAMSLGGSGAAALPMLMSELAVRVISGGSTPQAVVLNPPRNVNPSVTDAVAAISATTGSPFTEPVPVAAATAPPYLPSAYDTLQGTPSAASGLPDELLDTVQRVQDDEPAVTSLLSCPTSRPGTCAASATLLQSIPVAVQRIESSAWRQDRLVEGDTGTRGAQQLLATMQSLVNGVQIVRPSSGVYTLASSSASLPITVVNNLDYQADVKVRVSAAGGVPGFSTDDVRSRLVPARSKVTIEVPATVQRSGRIRVQAELTTPSGIALGAPLALTVHSTALGVVGVVITIVAGVLLLLALLIRGVRALHRRRHGQVRPPRRAEPVT